MQLDDFEAKVGASLQSADPDYARAKSALERYVAALSRQLAQGRSPDRIAVTVVPGYLVNMGQQLKVTIAVPSAKFEDVLFRAYVPASGYPVTLDLYGEEPVSCDTEEALGEAILRFVAEPTVRNRLATLREMAEK